MKVKKFVAPTMPEAMKMVQNELGKDAVILNSKVVQKGGIFGFFTKKNIEVIAAIDPQPIQKQKPLKKKELKSYQAEKPKIINEEQPKKHNPDLLRELQELKSMMKNITHNSQGLSYTNYPKQIQEALYFLEEQELDRQTIQSLTSSIIEKWYLNKETAEASDVLSWIKDELTKEISNFPFGGIDFTKKYINVVGPTGVGKTTTLAKIAAHCVLKFNKKVAFITTDTYRIAAIDQLKTYAKILNIPIEVAYSLEDFIDAKEKFRNYDLILIDTAGRNYRNQEYVNDLKKIINFDEELESYLVLGLTSKLTDMETIYKQFSLININKLIFTKVDETSNFGGMLNIIMKYKVGVAYLTNGQNVPDDIIEANPEKIINIFLEDKQS